MLKLYIFGALFTAYSLYTASVYFLGTKETAPPEIPFSNQAQQGKQLYQQYNCASCHQLFGLGGYLGPELTTGYTDPNRGALLMRAFLENGGPRMPNFHFSKGQIDCIMSYLQYADAAAVSYKKPYRNGY
jgi:nitric oxide reductase subunit C